MCTQNVEGQAGRREKPTNPINTEPPQEAAAAATRRHVMGRITTGVREFLKRPDQLMVRKQGKATRRSEKRSMLTKHREREREMN